MIAARDGWKQTGKCSSRIIADGFCFERNLLPVLWRRVELCCVAECIRRASLLRIRLDAPGPADFQSATQRRHSRFPICATEICGSLPVRGAMVVAKALEKSVPSAECGRRRRSAASPPSRTLSKRRAFGSEPAYSFALHESVNYRVQRLDWLRSGGAL